LKQEQESFLKYWVSGVFAGIKNLDAAAQKTIFTACGQACGDSYTVELFRKVREESASLEESLTHLGEKFPEAAYTMIGENQIQVTYQQCGCDLVRLGWVKNPILCQCSVKNLENNFSQGLGLDVTVILERSVLSGDEDCAFIVQIK